LTDAPLLAIRNYRPGDDGAWLALIQEAPDFRYDFFGRSASLDALRVMLEHPHMDAARNLFFAEAGGGLVGYGELWHAPGRPRGVIRVLVHPGWRRQGLGTRLLIAIEQRARELDTEYLDVQIESGQQGGRAFLHAGGLRPVHHSWHMVMPDITVAPEPVWPAGYEVRTFIVGLDEATSRGLENESFRDEWEYVPIPEGELEGVARSPSFRADGVIYALHDGQAVGECWSWIDDQAIAKTGVKQGDIWCLCVHPQHRRRGLGRTLLLAGVQWLRRQGMASAALYLDGANDCARHLYEAAGFVAARTDLWYREDL
jgi:mycothiol synthase